MSDELEGGGETIILCERGGDHVDGTGDLDAVELHFLPCLGNLLQHRLLHLLRLDHFLE